MRENHRAPLKVPAEVEPLIKAIRTRFRPDCIWLFGSRARGDNTPDSDWDLIVSLPDNAPPELLDPLVGWSIQHDLGIPATILSATTSQIAESWGAPNTIGYDLAREGRLIDG